MSARGGHRAAKRSKRARASLRDKRRRRREKMDRIPKPLYDEFGCIIPIGSCAVTYGARSSLSPLAKSDGQLMDMMRAVRGGR